VVLGFAVFWYYGVLVLWFGCLARRSPFAGRACWDILGFERCRLLRLGGKFRIFFSWMNLPSLRLRQAEETKIPGYTGTSFLTGKSQADDSRLQTRLGAGNNLMLGFQVDGAFGLKRVLQM
jgi:hypothetical protein